MFAKSWRYLTSALVLVLLACVDTNEPGPGPNPNPAPVVARVAVTAPATTVLVGTTMDLTARAHDAQDHEVTGLAVTWSSDKPAVASVSAAGHLEAKAEGAATITATIQGKSGSAAITVTAPIGPVTRIAIEPGALSLEEGTVRGLVATAYDAAGHVVPNQHFAWQSSDEGVVPVTAAGVATALRPGTVQITAISGAWTAQAAVDVWADWSFDLDRHHDRHRWRDRDRPGLRRGGAAQLGRVHARSRTGRSHAYRDIEHRCRILSRLQPSRG